MIMNQVSPQINPLLVGSGLPPFEQIQPEHIVPAMTQLLSELETELADLESNLVPTWENLVQPLNDLGERLSWSWGIVGHLMGVKNSSELRNAYRSIQPQVVQFINKLSQSQPIYEGFKSLRDSANWDTLNPAQQRIVTAAIRDAELSGVGLSGEKRDRFNEIQLELAGLATNFSNHVLDSTKAFQLKLTQPDRRLKDYHRVC